MASARHVVRLGRPEDPIPVTPPDPELTFNGFFGGLLATQVAHRSEALDEILDILRACADAPAPAGDDAMDGTDLGWTRGSHGEHRKRRLVELYGWKFLSTHYLSVHRLVHDCPYTDVSTRCLAFLQELSKRSDLALPPTPAVLGPSHFVTAEVSTSILARRAESNALLQEIFLCTGRVSHMDAIMGWHPSFFYAFQMSTQFLMREDGPLLRPWRNYIAIMAASRHRCQYLIHLQQLEFLWNGGDKSWLAGVQYADPRIVLLCELNAILAHQPWLLKPSHIQFLLKRPDHRWSVGELVQAISIMCAFHSMCGFVYGMGLTPELDYFTEEKSHTSPATTSGDAGAADGAATTTAAAAAGAAVQGTGGAEAADGACPQADEKDPESTATERLLKMLNSAESQPSESDTDPDQDFFDRAATKDNTKIDMGALEHCRQSEDFVGPFPMVYEDFNVKSKSYHVFHVPDFGWRGPWLTSIDWIYRGSGPLLDAELNCVFDLTYHTVNRLENIDTTPFRRALWYYTRRLYGVCYDDYDYRDVNKYLKIDLKKFVKKVACHPERITQEDFDHCGLELAPDEKAHVALLAVEARKASALCYGLHAVTTFMGSLRKH